MPKARESVLTSLAKLWTAISCSPDGMNLGLLESRDFARLYGAGEQVDGPEVVTGPCWDNV